jgi:hypothetical protein
MKIARSLLAFALLAFALGASAADLGFDKLEKALRLRPHQKEQFDRAVGATQRALLAVALSGMQLKERFEQEMAQRRPDFEGLMRAQEDALEQSRPLFLEARDEWMRLYALLDDDQVAIAKGFVQDRLGRLLK